MKNNSLKKLTIILLILLISIISFVGVYAQKLNRMENVMPKYKIEFCVLKQMNCLTQQETWNVKRVTSIKTLMPLVEQAVKVINSIGNLYLLKKKTHQNSLTLKKPLKRIQKFDLIWGLKQEGRKLVNYYRLKEKKNVKKR